MAELIAPSAPECDSGRAPSALSHHSEVFLKSCSIGSSISRDLIARER